MRLESPHYSRAHNLIGVGEWVLDLWNTCCIANSQINSKHVDDWKDAK